MRIYLFSCFELLAPRRCKFCKWISLEGRLGKMYNFSRPLSKHPSVKVVWWIESWKFLLTCSSNCLFVQGSLTALDCNKTAIYVISINELWVVANCWKHLFLLSILNSSIKRTKKMMERWGRLVLVVQRMTDWLKLRWSRSPFYKDETPQHDCQKKVICVMCVKGLRA